MAKSDLRISSPNLQSFFPCCLHISQLKASLFMQFLKPETWESPSATTSDLLVLYPKCVFNAMTSDQAAITSQLKDYSCSYLVPCFHVAPLQSIFHIAVKVICFHLYSYFVITF